MNDDKYVVKNGKPLRFGYTTGSCATAVAVACARMILTGVEVKSVIISLPRGEKVAFLIENIEISSEMVVCSVTKDAGDDPDVTDKIEIYGEAVLCEDGINIEGGQGIGVVTAKGLKCAIGEAAINPVPKKMIIQNTQAVFSELDYHKGIKIKISAPKGEEVAKHTFNSRLGIIGGISILGTTGIVEPMSETALIDTIKILVDRQKEIDSEKILISPGNYGRDYCKKHFKFDVENSIKFSNFIGETLDYINYQGYKKVLLVGHVGKLVKLAGGIMNTHSSTADCRMEIISAHTALVGGNQELVKSIMNCVTTDEAVELLENAGLDKLVWSSIMEKIQFQINYRVKNRLQTEVIIFGDSDKVIAKSPYADEFVMLFEEENI